MLHFTKKLSLRQTYSRIAHMAKEYREISRQLPPEYEKGGKILNALVDSLVSLGELPSSLGKITRVPQVLTLWSAKDLEQLAREIMTELAGRASIVEDTNAQVSARQQNTFLDTNENWQLQINRLIKLGYPTTLGLSEFEYRASIPQFQPQPEKFKGRFDILLLVDPRVSLKRQLSKQQVSFPEHDQFSDYEDLVIPDQPYQLWAQGGSRFRKLSPQDARSRFAEDERGLSLIEGLALFREHPDILLSHPIDLLGSTRLVRTTSEVTTHIPRIVHVLEGKASIRSYRDDRKPKKAAAASCGIVPN